MTTYFTKVNTIIPRVGLINTGNTCFLNTALQSLIQNPLITHYFENRQEIIETVLKNTKRILFETNGDPKPITIGMDKEMLQNIWNNAPSTYSINEQANILARSISIALGDLIQVSREKNSVVVPLRFRKLFSCLRNNYFSNNDQHDSSEAYNCIIEAIQNELYVGISSYKVHTDPSLDKLVKTVKSFKKALKTGNFTDEQKKHYENQYLELKRKRLADFKLAEKLFGIEEIMRDSYSPFSHLSTVLENSTITCSKCEFSSSTIGSNTQINLSISKSQPTIYDCLDKYTGPEKLDGSNRWFCDNCGHAVDATKKTDLLNLPKTISFVFSRFSNWGEKLDTNISAPMTNLDMKKYLDPLNNKSQCYNYTLISVIDHIGTHSRGHYYAKCLDLKTGFWNVFNDEKVSPIRHSEVVSNIGYMFVYIRNDMIVDLTKS